MNRNEWFAANALISLGLIALAVVSGIGLPGAGAFMALPLLAAGILELAGQPLPVAKAAERNGS
jgi:hypothetical protein